MILGLISDTHTLLRPEALAALQGSDLILHAGDIGSPEVLSALQAIAPVLAIRGNNDRDAWAKDLPETRTFEVEGKRLHLLHDVKTLSLDPAAAGFHAVISGHSHKPKIETRNGVLFINPGSAGPRRFKLPIALARLVIAPEGMDAKIVLLA